MPACWKTWVWRTSYAHLAYRSSVQPSADSRQRTSSTGAPRLMVAGSVCTGRSSCSLVIDAWRSWNMSLGGRVKLSFVVATSTSGAAMLPRCGTRRRQSVHFAPGEPATRRTFLAAGARRASAMGWALEDLPNAVTLPLDSHGGGSHIGPPSMQPPEADGARVSFRGPSGFPYRV